jgi:hypothetical protein
MMDKQSSQRTRSPMSACTYGLVIIGCGSAAYAAAIGSRLRNAGVCSATTDRKDAFGWPLASRAV